ncbi:MAG: FAD-binding protein [Candidatus Nanopelagicales bacterium]|nr:FAD-binding protein [Candidatus Nanopelagicales bacterium]
MTLAPGLVDDITIVVGSRWSDAEADLDRHGQDESWHHPMPPDLVVYPHSTEEVAAVVRACHRAGSAVIPFGVGTSLEGGIGAEQGGVCLDLSEMNRITRVSIDDLDATVEAGVTREQLNAHLNPQGLMFPVDPGANATIGGMAATGASGTTTVRYGAMPHNVLGLTVVMADGRIVQTGGRARKTSSGYDLTRLFVGSEGTLGVITEITLRLYPIPEAIAAATCTFDSVDDAVNVVMASIQLALPVARMELLDEAAIEAVNAFDQMDLRVAPTLFFEFHGITGAVDACADEVRRLVADAGGTFEWATAVEDRSRLWHARHRAYWAMLAMRPGSKGWPTDVCVPISHLADQIREAQQDLATSNLYAPLVGHVGDGNFHFCYILDPNDSEEFTRAEAHYERMITRALDVGGTCTGEHGIGAGKRDFLRREHPQGVEVMQMIKAALDPTFILNPGKVI